MATLKEKIQARNKRFKEKIAEKKVVRNAAKVAKRMGSSGNHPAAPSKPSAPPDNTPTTDDSSDTNG